MYLTRLYFIILIAILHCVCSSFDDYVKQRNSFISSFFDDSIAGGSAPYTSQEENVANIISQLKSKEIQKVRADNSEFLTRQTFSGAQEYIEKTELYKLLKKFPKGSILHTHFTLTLDSSWVYFNGILREDCYRYYGGFRTDGTTEYYPGEYRIFDPSQPQKIPGQFIRFLDVRNKSSNVTLFDEARLQELKMNETDEIGSGQHRWQKFGYINLLIYHVIFFDQVFEQYFNELVSRMVQDRILYAEVSSPLGYDTLHDYNRSYTMEEHVMYLQKLSDQAKQKYSEFLGLKIRHSMGKSVSLVEHLGEEMDRIIDLHSRFKDFVIAFDLVGEEDTNPNTFSFAKVLFEAKQKVEKNDSLTFNFMFHAGESDWSNDNILDAILLGTVRIGHGFNIYRFPGLLELVKKKKIAIEVCPISNHILGMSLDSRTHPFVNFIADNVPFVVAPDDGGVFGYDVHIMTFANIDHFSHFV